MKSRRVRGGGLSFRLAGQGQERFTRLRPPTLGEGYDLKDILAVIDGSRKRSGQSPRKGQSAGGYSGKAGRGKGPGYERWAKSIQLKQMAAALAYLQDNGLTEYGELEKKAAETTDCFHVLSDQIKRTENAMNTNRELKAATVQYARTRPVFEKYKAAKYSRKFLCGA